MCGGNLETFIATKDKLVMRGILQNNFNVCIVGCNIISCILLLFGKLYISLFEKNCLLYINFYQSDVWHVFFPIHLRHAQQHSLGLVRESVGVPWIRPTLTYKTGL